MIATPFDPALDAIVVDTILWNDRGASRSVRMVLDTGAAMTDLPDGHGIQGLLGFDFLRRFNYCVLSTLGELRVAVSA